MRFPEPLLPGRLVRRYKRFLADVELAGGPVTAHCPNTGSMLGCADPGSRVWLSVSASPARKYPHTLELVQTAPDTLVGVHTGRSNALVEEAILDGTLAELAGYARLRREQRYGAEGSRIDLLLERDDAACHVEVKNVTAAVQDGVALFPDAVSERGTKHLRELMALARSGQRAVLVFCAQRSDVREVRPADAIDPLYGKTLREAIGAGVEALAYRAEVSPLEIRLARRVPVVCP